MLPRWHARGTLIARAAGVGGGATFNSLANAPTRHTSDHPLQPSALFRDSPEPVGDEHAVLYARAENRAWRQGALQPDRSATPTRGAAHEAPRSRSLLQFLLHEDSRAAQTRLACAKPPSRLQQDFESFEMLGRGGFGVVYGAKSRTDQHAFALKLVSADERDGDPFAEARCMAALPAHDNLVRYHGSWLEEQPITELRQELEAAERGGVISTGRPSLYLTPLAAAASVADADVFSDGDSSGDWSSDDGSGSDLRAHAERSPARLAFHQSRTLCMQLELCASPTLQAILQGAQRPLPRCGRSLLCACVCVLARACACLRVPAHACACLRVPARTCVPARACLVHRSCIVLQER